MASASGNSGWPCRLAFSTLGAPDWSIRRVADAVAAYGYDGIELRLLGGALIEATAVDQETREDVASVLGRADVPIVCLDTSARLFGTSTRLAGGDSYAELQAAIELAHEWEAPFVRVFGGELDPEVRQGSAYDEIGDRLVPLLDVAETLGVCIVLETHDSFSSAASVAKLLNDIAHPSLGALWDIRHTWAQGELPEEAVALLGDRLRLVHVKDDRSTADAMDLCLLGEGRVPVQESLSALRRSGYTGWVSVEWEKLWHPGLPEPEVALPQHAELLHEWMESATT